MFPPVEPRVLEENPGFAKVYEDITASLLKGDCSRKIAETNEVRAVHEQLTAHRLKVARRHILLSALQTTTSTAPPHLSDLLLLLPPLLSHTVSPSSAALLLSTPPLSDLPAHLQTLSPLLSTTLVTTALGVTRVANPNIPGARLTRSVADLAKSYVSLQQELAVAREDLAHLRREVAEMTVDVLRKRMEILTKLTVMIEFKGTDGAVGNMLKASILEAAAQKAALEARMAKITTEKILFDPTVRAALVNYQRHLLDAKMRLGGAIKMREMEVAEYGVGVPGQEGKVEVLRELARATKELEGAVSKV